MRAPTVAGVELAPPSPERFTSRLRSPAVAARIGLWLGISFGVCFLTGLVSHYAQNGDQPVTFPTSPAWGYRVTQGLHVLSGTAAIPLLLVKLWAVYPKLFESFPLRDAKALLLVVLERVSILALVASGIFELTIGLQNITHWYPWDFSFRATHYALAWVAIGSLLVHIAVKLPIIRDVLTSDVDDTVHDRPTAIERGALTRRGLLRTTYGAAGLAVLATAGQSVPFLRDVSIFGVRSGDGPGGVPINRSADQANITDDLVGDDYRFTVASGATSMSFSREELLAMPQSTESLPIACVEGWSASATWTGVRLRDLLDLVGAPEGADIKVSSIQPSGPYRVTLLQSNFARDERTLVALMLNGETLARDHGYPARLIAPNRPGVLQTKWLGSVETL